MPTSDVIEESNKKEITSSRQSASEKIWYESDMYVIVFTVVILLVTFGGKNVHELAERCKLSWISAVVVAVVFIWCVVSLSGVSTFLYFNF